MKRLKRIFHRVSQRHLWVRFLIPMVPLAVYGAATLWWLSVELGSSAAVRMLGILALVFAMVAGMALVRMFSLRESSALGKITLALKVASQGDLTTRLPEVGSSALDGTLYFNRFLDQMATCGHKLRSEIRERQLTEQALTESKALFDVFMSHLPALAIIKDATGRYLYVNEACRTLLNKTPEEMVGAKDLDLWPEGCAVSMGHHDRQVMEHNQVLSAIEKITVAGEHRYHLVTKFPLLKKNQPHMLAAIAFDITDKVQAEEDKARLEQQLIQAQKMEAIGTLAGGIAHDFNNVLAAILGYVELAQLDAIQGHKVNTDLDQVLKATHRAKDLVRQILTFSRKTEQDRQPMDPEPLVKEALKLLRASLPTTIDIRTQFKSNAALIMANATQLHQVIMNLCTNAAHAMERHGGVLEVGLQHVDLANSSAAEQGVTPGSYLELSIRDTGHGITPALQASIFDPYFTTKAKDKGTGMGLAVVHGIVKSHCGTIGVESEPGHGACFRVLFPISDGDLESPTIQDDTLPKGSESVLFVDDELFLVDLGQQMLDRLGYKVTSCASSIEALEKMKAAPMQYDLIITDMTMPQMTGDELAKRILEIRPDMPIIMCTGYSETVAAEMASRVGLAGFVMKPVTITDLACAIRKALDGRADSSFAMHSAPHLKLITNH